MSHPSVDRIRPIPSTTRPEVSEKYWSKLVTSQVYLDNPGDIVAALEARLGGCHAPQGAGGQRCGNRCQEPAAPLISGYGSTRS